MAESRSWRWQLKKQAAGLCMGCGAKRRIGKQYCRSCRDKNRVQARNGMRRLRGSKAWRPGSCGPVPFDATASQRAKHAKLVVAKIEVLNEKLQALREQEKTNV